MRRRLVMLGLSITLAPAALWPSGVDAGQSNEWTTGTIEDDQPVAIAAQGPDGTVLHSYTPGKAAKKKGKKGPAWVCRYYIPSSNEFGVPAPAPGTDPVVPEAGQIYVFICLDSATGEATHTSFVLYDPANPFGDLYAGERAAEVAVERLPLPDPDLWLSPPASAFQLVGVPTWFWVGEGWVGQSATASVAGIAATVAAVPVSLVVDPGDGGGLVECEGAGVVWVEGRSSGCTHTFTRSSRHEVSGRYPVVATVSWAVSWTATDGTSGDLGTLTRSTTLDVLVQEAQAVSD